MKPCFNIRYNVYSFIFSIDDDSLRAEYIKFIAGIINTDVVKFAINFGSLQTTMNQQKLSLQDAYVYYGEDKYIRRGKSTPLGNYIALLYNAYTSNGLMVTTESKDIIIPNEVLNKIAYFYIGHPKLKHDDITNDQIYPSFSERVVDKVVNLWVDRIKEIRSQSNRPSSDYREA